MTKKDDRNSNEQSEPRIGPPEQPNREEDYKVGPGRPPRNTQFKRGGPSPNPRGRPRKEATMHLDLKKAFEQAINKKIRVSQADKKVFMTRIQAGFEQLLNQFAKGDRYARKDLMAYGDKLEVDFLAAHRQTLEQALAPNLQAILDACVARRSNSGNIEPTTPVLASSELLNDDCEPAANPTAGSEAKTEPTAVASASAQNNTGPAPRPPLLIKNEAAPAAPSVATAPIDPAPRSSGVAATTAAAASISAATASRSVTGLAPQSKAPPVRRPAPAAPATQPRPISPPPPDPEPEPPLKPGVKYPKPFEEMTPRTKWIYFPDWCAEHPERCNKRAIFPGDKR